jgi:hypothetical protein
MPLAVRCQWFFFRPASFAAARRRRCNTLPGRSITVANPNPKETTMRLVTTILFADLGIKHCSPMNRIQWTATAVTFAMWFCRA